MIFPDEKAIREKAEAMTLYDYSIETADGRRVICSVDFKTKIIQGAQWATQHIKDNASEGWSGYEKTIEHLEGYVYVAKDAYQAATISSEARHAKELEVLRQENKELKSALLFAAKIVYALEPLGDEGSTITKFRAKYASLIQKLLEQKEGEG